MVGRQANAGLYAYAHAPGDHVATTQGRPYEASQFVENLHKE